jgi:hypothetical protein
MIREYSNWLIAIVAMGICAIGIFQFEKQRERRIAQGHLIQHERIKLESVTAMLEILLIDDPSILNNVETGKDYNNDEIIEILRHSKGARYLEDYLRESNGFKDFWNHPLHFQFDKVDVKNEKARIRVWSIGTNGIDEHGKGDDISDTYEIR